jgi:ABC-type phosphate transport system substrate-binding protein
LARVQAVEPFWIKPLISQHRMIQSRQLIVTRLNKGVVQIPMVGGTIAFGYNKPGCDLKLTQQQAVQVAIGKITNWKDLGCEAGTITWVHRSDGSGTTESLYEFHAGVFA